MFDIQLPYALETQQLAAIQKECAEGIAIAPVGERMTVTIPLKADRVHRPAARSWLGN